MCLVLVLVLVLVFVLVLALLLVFLGLVCVAVLDMVFHAVFGAFLSVLHGFLDLQIVMRFARGCFRGAIFFAGHACPLASLLLVWSSILCDQ